MRTDYLLLNSLFLFQSTPGTLNFLEDEDSLRHRLTNNEPINYRIDFPTPGVVPKLTKVTVNGKVACEAVPCK